MIETQPRPEIKVYQIERTSFTDFYLTSISTAKGGVKEQVEGLYEGLLRVVLDNNIQIIQEKIHGKASALPEFRESRSEILAGSAWDASIPYTYVEGYPLDGQAIVSVQVWGIRNHTNEIQVRTDKNPVNPTRVWETHNSKLIYCPCIHGLDPSQLDQSIGKSEQCQIMFDRTTTALNRHHLSFKDVARTWIYMSRMLEWYGEFNRIRTKHFKEVGVYSTGKRPVFPASTGIQGRFSNYDECFLDVLAVDSKTTDGIEMTPITTTSRQQQSFDYGSAFSRGMVLKQEGIKTVYVSGTASINNIGDSLYIDDTEMQTLDTLMNIASLLEDQGGSLKDTKTGVVYCKNQEVYQAFKRALQLLGIPEMPLVCVEADVCRHELLIEIEIVAVIKDN